MNAVNSESSKTMEPIFNIDLKFITFNELRLLSSCEQNQKIVDNWVDFMISIEPLPDRSAVPLNQVFKKDK